jgi:hypothetical protein
MVTFISSQTVDFGGLVHVAFTGEVPVQADPLEGAPGRSLVTRCFVQNAGMPNFRVAGTLPPTATADLLVAYSQACSSKPGSVSSLKPPKG